MIDKQMPKIDPKADDSSKTSKIKWKKSNLEEIKEPEIELEETGTF